MISNFTGLQGNSGNRSRCGRAPRHSTAAAAFRFAGKVNLRVSARHGVVQSEPCCLVKVRECVPKSGHESPTSGNTKGISPKSTQIILTFFDEHSGLLARALQRN